MSGRPGPGRRQSWGSWVSTTHNNDNRGARVDQHDATRAPLRPDGILVDIDLGDESGLDLARELASTGAAAVVLISAYPDSEFVDLVTSSPAIGSCPNPSCQRPVATLIRRR